ncbi:ComEC/Rec2 family competence protein [Flagellimonas sp. CMM7]|uniref:ComEC/Rec2 family competence protein n=1 Tax=Flagellimonas sp. CMM7 TaxID=2654676 RepID=UPI0013D470D6|nr:hypothetical protein [Flagellimonas sp. CMM7]UII81078.1 hypothetical protein LV704_06070 [Flagellimonas sp. CMM7]
MTKGWVRAYSEENSMVNSSEPYQKRQLRAKFRKKFRTELKSNSSETASVLRTLKWGDEVELPNQLENTKWTRVKFKSQQGFVLSKHLVEIAYVRKTGTSNSGLVKSMKTAKNKNKKLLWGDLVQISKRGRSICEVRVRGTHGKMSTKDLVSEPLLEVYFVDVTQGDGVLVCTPDKRHLLIDGGLERTKQLTGKNAADFIDWKFFMDYGAFEIDLDSMMASHSDNDHYGGLHDLVRSDSPMSDRELDSLKVNIKTFHHPGLSRWRNNTSANPKHSQGLGAATSEGFIQLLGDRSDAEGAVSKDSVEKLSGPWKSFINDVLNNSVSTKVERITLDRNVLSSGRNLPNLWKTKHGCEIKILGPVSFVDGKGRETLPDFGKKSFNTNGHSICLRIDYGDSKILLTGDLNSESMDWISNCYGDRIGAWECDVAKACHHGGNDISYKFLEKIKAAATIISSGDAEGHAHPRPEIVGASATTGFKNIDRHKDKLITPLIYMTEIERSVTLGAVNRIDFEGLPIGSNTLDGVILGRELDEFNDKAHLSPEQFWKHKAIKDKNEANRFLRKAVREQKKILTPIEKEGKKGNIKVNFNLTKPNGPLSPENTIKSAWRSRVMEKNHYGLVNVRTDGDTIMCATLDETEHKWVAHSFPARF